LHCRSTHSRLSQAAIRSSGMWCQEMLPSILHGCHFDTISSFSIKNFVPDIFDQTSFLAVEINSVLTVINTIEKLFTLTVKSCELFPLFCYLPYQKVCHDWCRFD
jgi:hypothetical protein